MSNYSKGSAWRRWDLHFHTPSSYDYQNRSITNQEIINTLIENNISVVAITDHHIIDVQRIEELQRLAAGKLCVLPGIEFCSELGGSESIHFIGIFSESADIKSIWTKIQGRHNLTSTDIASKGEQNIQCKFEETCKTIKELGGVISVHAGSKTNSIESIKNQLLVKQEQKQELLSKYIDILEVGKIADEKDYKNIVFQNIGFDLPIILCSDNHNSSQYSLKSNLWIKADPNFEGLRQIFIEPTDRVFIGDVPPDKDVKDRNKQNIIDSIELLTSSDNNEWFDSVRKVELNPGLVTIIGNKGSGKSALADILGLTGNSYRTNFSFLRRDKFYKSHKQGKYTANITFLDNYQNQRFLKEDTADPSKPEKVIYLSQSFVNDLCDYIGERDDLQKEIDRVIFSHIPLAYRLNKLSLEEIIQERTKEIINAIQLTITKIKSINTTIIQKESMSSVEYGEAIKKKLDELTRQHQYILTNEVPKEIKNPEGTQSDESIEKIKSNETVINNNLITIKEQKDLLSKNNLKKEQVSRIIQKISLFQSSYDDLKKELDNDSLLKDNNIIFEQIINLVISNEDIIRIEKECIDTEISINKIISEKETENDVLIKGNNSLKEKLGVEQKQYQNYVENKQKYDKKLEQIFGSDDSQNMETIRGLNAIQNYIKNGLPAELKTLYAERARISDQIIELIFNKEKAIKDLYKHVQDISNDIARKFGIEIDDFIGFNSDIRIGNTFKEDILSFINKNNCKDFDKKLDAILKDITNTKETLKTIPDEIIKILKESRDIHDISTLINKKGILDFYNYVYSCAYIESNFCITYAQKNISMLSPGEKGLLLLIFYLLIDNDKKPIIIDQPEENLDNETVFLSLVPFIKEAKKQRQIIIVTHNPNLAIVCDAEQIIYASIDKTKNNNISYTSGSIENNKMRECALRILEGTKPAFGIRKEKYRI